MLREDEIPDSVTPDNSAKLKSKQVIPPVAYPPYKAKKKVYKGIGCIFYIVGLIVIVVIIIILVSDHNKREEGKKAKPKIEFEAQIKMMADKYKPNIYFSDSSSFHYTAQIQRFIEDTNKYVIFSGLIKLDDVLKDGNRYYMTGTFFTQNRYLFSLSFKLECSNRQEIDFY